MTVFEADVDMDMWDEIVTRLLDIYGKGNPVIMNKTARKNFSLQ